MCRAVVGGQGWGACWKGELLYTKDSQEALLWVTFCQDLQVGVDKRSGCIKIEEMARNSNCWLP